MMSIIVEAVYEDGVLKLDRPLPLKDRQRVRVSVETEENWVQRTSGLLGWTGDAETVERFALDPEFNPHEGP